MKKLYILKLQISLILFLSLANFIIAQDQNCLLFDGEDDFIALPVEVGQKLGANDFTFEVQISGLEDDNVVPGATILSNRVSTNSGIHIFIHDYWGGSVHKMLTVRYNGINWLYINNGDFNGKILDGECHHLAITKLNNTISFYIDGILVGERENQPDINLNTNAPIFIGSEGGENPFFGVINDVRIWNIGKTQAEIQAGIDDGIDLNEEGLLGYWELREGSGQVVYDLTEQADAFIGEEVNTDNSDPTWGIECCGEGFSTDVSDLDSEAKSLLVYPNPNKGVVAIDLETKFVPNKYNYILFDNMGKLVESKPLLNPTLDLRKFVPGQYFIKVFNSQEVLGISKIVIIE